MASGQGPCAMIPAAQPWHELAAEYTFEPERDIHRISDRRKKAVSQHEDAG